MFENLYYYGLHFFDNYGLLLLAGAILVYLGIYLTKRHNKFAIPLISIGVIILLFGGVLKLLYFIFFVGLGIGFWLYYFTKNE